MECLFVIYGWMLLAYRKVKSQLHSNVINFLANSESFFTAARPKEIRKTI